MPTLFWLCNFCNGRFPNQEFAAWHERYGCPAADRARRQRYRVQALDKVLRIIEHLRRMDTDSEYRAAWTADVPSDTATTRRKRGGR